MIRIAPSILSADFAALAEAIDSVAPASDWIHVDVMDGHFVPNLTIGPPVVAAIRRHTSLPLDCHLMMSDPGAYVDEFADAGADSVTVHIEAVPDPRQVFAVLSEKGIARGLSLNPGTPFEAVEPFLDETDVLLVMTVQPGFGGQSFRADVLPKVEKAAEWILSHGVRADIEVDGGVSEKTARSVADAGARILVAGSAVFDAPDPCVAADRLRRSALAPRPAAAAAAGA